VLGCSIPVLSREMVSLVNQRMRLQVESWKLSNKVSYSSRLDTHKSVSAVRIQNQFSPTPDHVAILVVVMNW
jgi:hypothetical protein